MKAERHMHRIFNSNNTQLHVRKESVVIVLCESVRSLVLSEDEMETLPDNVTRSESMRNTQVSSLIQFHSFSLHETSATCRGNCLICHPWLQRPFEASHWCSVTSIPSSASSQDRHSEQLHDPNCGHHQHWSFPHSKELTFNKLCCFGILKSLEQ